MPDWFSQSPVVRKKLATEFDPLRWLGAATYPVRECGFGHGTLQDFEAASVRLEVGTLGLTTTRRRPVFQSWPWRGIARTSRRSPPESVSIETKAPNEKTRSLATTGFRTPPTDVLNESDERKV